MFKLDNLNTLLYVLIINNKVKGDKYKMCDQCRPNIKIQKVLTKKILEANSCSCGCYGVPTEQADIDDSNKKKFYDKKVMS